MDKIEQKILSIIEQRKDDIIAFGDDIWRHGERGFQEYRTSAKLREELEKLGVKSMQTGIAVTGLKCYLKDPKEEHKHTIALMGEMDGLPMPTHKNVNPETGVAHGCWHHTQITGMLGAAMALTDPEVAAAIDGNIAFIGCPAEEQGDTPELMKLREQGKIKYFGGKDEFIRLGELDDLDMIIAHHTMAWGLGINNLSTNCFVKKHVTFHGKSAHGTRAAFGVDALEAASLAMTAINTLRECFQEKDYVRIHGFVAEGGTADNIIADHTVLNYQVRAKTLPALRNAEWRFDRAVRGAAMAIGAGCTIETYPGYLSDRPAKHIELLEEVLHDLKPDAQLVIRYSGKDPSIHQVGSNDYGEVSQILPFVKFTTGGSSGVAHTDSADITDPYEAYVVPAQVFAIYAYRLMKDQAKGLEHFLEGFEPAMTAQEVCDVFDSMLRVEEIPMNPAPDFEGNTDDTL